jgi:hypothetical protein
MKSFVMGLILATAPGLTFASNISIICSNHSGSVVVDVINKTATVYGQETSTERLSSTRESEIVELSEGGCFESTFSEPGEVIEEDTTSRTSSSKLYLMKVEIKQKCRRSMTPAFQYNLDPLSRSVSETLLCKKVTTWRPPR